MFPVMSCLSDYQQLHEPSSHLLVRRNALVPLPIVGSTEMLVLGNVNADVLCMLKLVAPTSKSLWYEGAITADKWMKKRFLHKTFNMSEGFQGPNASFQQPQPMAFFTAYHRVRPAPDANLFFLAEKGSRIKEVSYLMPDNGVHTTFPHKIEH
jgi:hypothetical protein